MMEELKKTPITEEKPMLLEFSKLKD